MFDCLYSTDIEEFSFEPWQDELWEYSFNAVDLSPSWVDNEGKLDINHCFNEIKNHTYGYIKVGVISWVVRTRKFYQVWCTSFTEFCRKYLGRTVWQINRIIEASEVALNLMSCGFKQLPLNESQCRPLSGLDESTLIDIWKYITDNVPSEKITANVIQCIVENWNKVDSDYKKVSPKTVKLDRNKWDRLQEKATLLGVKPRDLIDKLIDNYLDDTENTTDVLPAYGLRSNEELTANAECNTDDTGRMGEFEGYTFPAVPVPFSLQDGINRFATDKKYKCVTEITDSADKLLSSFNALMSKGLRAIADTS